MTTRRVLRAGMGIPLGVVMSAICGFIFLKVLGAPSSLFYVFAALTFVLAPLAAGTVDTLIDPSHRPGLFLLSGGVVFATVFVLFFLTYGISIRLLTTSVALPEYCDGTFGQAQIPSNLEYSFPDETKGILLGSDDSTAVVATLDYAHPPHPGTLFIIDRASGKTVLRVNFPDDNIAAAMDSNTVYLFNKGIGLFVDKVTGERENYFLTMDTYGTNEFGYFETSGVVSSWDRNGSVKSLAYLTFNGIVQGCYVSAATQEAVRLK